MKFDHEDVYGIEMYRVGVDKHGTQCATLASTGVLIFLPHHHDAAKWRSEVTQDPPDIETLYVRRWQAEWYPTVFAEVLRQEAEST